MVASDSGLLLDENPAGLRLMMRDRQGHQSALKTTTYQNVVHLPVDRIAIVQQGTSARCVFTRVESAHSCSNKCGTAIADNPMNSI